LRRELLYTNHSQHFSSSGADGVCVCDLKLSPLGAQVLLTAFPTQREEKKRVHLAVKWDLSENDTRKISKLQHETCNETLS
jgi:hypothetical protein